MRRFVTNLLSNIPLIQNYFSGMAAIFMLHRVSHFESIKLQPNENMKISPEFLEKFIFNLKSQGYKFISLDDIYNILKKGNKIKKQIAFTMDDGYRDNYEIAYPIFKKYDIPFAIYVTTSFPQNKAILWWYALEDLILKNKTLKLSNGKIYDCKTKEQKEDTFLRLREVIISFDRKDFLNSLNNLFCDYGVDWFANNNELCMDWKQIIELSKDDMCTIAGHTKNHYALNKLTIEEVKTEIMEANNLLEEKIGKKIEHFAYPFGSRFEIGQREFDIVKSMGFKTAVTTRAGTIYKEHIDHLESLPRIMLTENFDIKSIGRIRRSKVVTI